MSEGILSVGTCFSVSSTAPTTLDASGYAALTWTASGEVTNFGELGGTAEIGKFTTVCDGKVNKRPGPIDPGSQNLELACVPDNAAQVKLKAAFKGRTKVYCKLAYPTGDIDYYSAYVAKAPKRIGAATDLLALNVTLEIDGSIVEVAAP